MAVHFKVFQIDHFNSFLCFLNFEFSRQDAPIVIYNTIVCLGLPSLQMMLLLVALMLVATAVAKKKMKGYYYPVYHYPVYHYGGYGGHYGGYGGGHSSGYGGKEFIFILIKLTPIFD